MNSFRPGIGLLAQESAVPIVPVALAGLYDAQAHWFHAGRIEVRVGEPIAPQPNSDPALLTNTLERSVRSLLR
jgi:long-chain acyl-CoA synthetase